MLIESTRFGTLDIPKEEIIHFPEGLPGFPEEKGFVHISLEKDSSFSFFQSVKEPNLTFLLVDPFAFFPDYEFDLEDDLAKEWGLSLENPPQIHLIATLKEKVTDMTVNLLAPLIINPAQRTGRQHIFTNSNYSIRHKLFPNGLANEAPKGGK